jgi:hypothetical protein
MRSSIDSKKTSDVVMESDAKIGDNWNDMEELK